MENLYRPKKESRDDKPFRTIDFSFIWIHDVNGVIAVVVVVVDLPVTVVVIVAVDVVVDGCILIIFDKLFSSDEKKEF